MRKKNSEFTKIILICLFLMLLSGCGKQKNTYEVNFVSVGEGYAVEIVKGESKWNNLETGVFGVQVSYDDFDNVSEIEYAYYKEYSEVNEGFIAIAEITTEDGSVFRTEDSYRISEEGVEIVRNFEVLEGGDAQGFMTYYPIRDVQTGEVLSREWFAPGAYYGNEQCNFWGSGIKFGYSKNAVANVDNLSAPIMANYYNGIAMSITDRTRGYRETIVDDAWATTSSIMVDEVFNIPGIGLKGVGDNEKMQVEMYHCYPTPTHNYINLYPFVYNYRMLPITEGLYRETAFEIKIDEYEDFDAAIENLWNEVYEEYAVVEYRYTPLEVYEVLTEHVYNSHAVINGIPQYMTETDHFCSESGFLYRNTDLASLMISAGYRLNKPEYIEQATELIDFHVDKDLMVDNVVYEMERSETEGVMAVLEAYKTHLEHGVNKSDWLAYVLEKTEQKREVADAMNIPLFLMVAEYTKDNSLVELSAEILEHYEENHEKYFYEGAIMNPAADIIPSRESAMIFIDVYLKMYEMTGEKKYLEMSEKCAIYTESNMILQNIEMEAKGSTGYEASDTGRYREIGMLGNSQVKPYGLSWISGQTGSADNYLAYAVPTFIRLSEVTGNQGYKEFADYTMTNTMLYVNMGDKDWIMDDIRHSTGYGFQNEYFGIAASSDSESSGRGTMHMSNLAWNMFVILYGLDFIADYDENFFTDLPTYDTAVLKYAESTSNENSLYRAYNAVDKRNKTAWKPASDDSERKLTILLGEFIQVEKIEVKATGEYKTSISMDGEIYTEVDANAVDDMCRYVCVEVAEGVSVNNVSVLGNPVVSKNYAIDSEVTVQGVPIKEMTDWDYSTVWRSTKQTDTITVDLGKICAVTEISMLFNININFSGQEYISSVDDIYYQYLIECSPDGENWNDYVDRSNNTEAKALYSEDEFVRARYFRITAKASSGTLTLNELKVYGK